MKKIYKAKEIQQILEKQFAKEYELVLYTIESDTEHKEDLVNNKKLTSLTTLGNAFFLNEKALSFYDIYDKNYALLAVPKTIYFNNQKYFIGEVGYNNVVASILCEDFIPKEFIYAYAEKDFNKEDEILFDENKKHICFMSKQKQEQTIQKILSKKHITFEMLEAINQENLSFKGKIEEEKIVLETIKQKKIYERNNKTIKGTTEDFFLKMKQDLKENYYIGLHNIRVDHCYYFLKDKHFALHTACDFHLFDKVYQVAYNQIIEEGLEVPYGNMLYTVTSFGSIESLRKRDLFSYNYWESFNCCNVVISIPKEFYIDGKNYFIGTLNNGFGSRMETILNSVLLKEKVPSEFIYGYYMKRFENEDTCLFHTNENHIHNKPLKEQEQFYKSLLISCNIDKNTLEIIEEEQETASDVLRNTIEEKRRVFKTEEKLKVKQKNLYSLD